MVTTSRIGIHLRLLAVSIACTAALLIPAAAGIPQARAADDASCATAAALVTRGLPREAKALLAAKGPPTCPDAASAATEAIRKSALDLADAEASLRAEKWAAAEASAQSSLDTDRENVDADKVRMQASLGLAKAKPAVSKPGAAKPAQEKSWLEKLQHEWNHFFDHQLSPMGALLLPFLGVLFGLVVVARLVVLAVPRWPSADDLPRGEALPEDAGKAKDETTPKEVGEAKQDEHVEGPDPSRGAVLPRQVFREYILTAGLVSVGGASLLASVVTADAASHPLSPALTAVTLVVTAVAAGWGGWTASHSWQRPKPETEPPTRPEGATESAFTRGVNRLLRRGGNSGQDRQGQRRWARTTRKAVLRLSAGAGVLAVVVLVARLAAGNDVSDRTAPLASLVLAAVLAIQGVWLLAWWLATRIRLDVKGPTGAAEVGTVAAVLYELGAEKPQGLEVPRGADVTALDGALGSLPDNPVLKVLKDIIRSISGVTPWTATIEGDATARVVTVVRNGRTLGSAILDPQRLGIEDQGSSTADKAPSTDKATAAASSTSKAASPVTADRTLQMAAAFVLATMAKEHPVIARGLAGCTSWKSVGYQYIGSTIRVLPSETAARDQKLALLGRALDEDGGNRAARLAFRHAVDRDATDCQTLDRYATFLVDFSTDLDNHEDEFETAALRLRAVYTRAIVLVNAVYAHGEDGHTTDAGEPCGLRREDLTEQAQLALSRLLELVEVKPGASSADPLAEFKRQFEDDVQGTLLLARLTPDAPTPNSPIGMYNLGCALASRHDVEWPPSKPAPTLTDDRTVAKTTREADDLTALTWLQFASQDPQTKEWMADDPQLAKFRTRRTYRNNFLTKPRDDFFTLSTVTPFASQLKTSGYGDVSLLATAEPRSLGVDLSAAPGVCAQLVELARLHRGLSAFDASLESQPLARLLQALEEGPPPPSPRRIAWAVAVVASMHQYQARPSTQKAAPVNLEGWAVEILDDLTKSGLARRGTLVALPADRQVAVAKKVAATLMKKHQPGDRKDTGDLDDYEKRLSATIAAWFRQPY